MNLADYKTRVELRNILFATDFSSSSEAALPYALAIARRYASRIYLAHVIRPDAYQLVAPEAMSAVLDQTRSYAEEQMARLLVSGRLRGVPHQVLIGQGEFWPVLSGVIEQHEIDLIVAGTHGRTGIQKLLLGSVAEEIFRLATCPVLTVGPKVVVNVRNEIEIRHILYATDFSSVSERAAPYALSLAQEHHAHLTLLHVLEKVPEPFSDGYSTHRELANGKLRALVPADAALWCDPEFTITYGDPVEGILETAVERQADLIVLGARRPAHFPGLLPPATAYKVVSRAHCPVLTVRG